MKAFLVLCDAAAQHPDGTFSMLRAGINRVHAAQAPIQFQGSLVAYLKANLGDAGQHSFDLRCMDQDGGVIGPQLQGQFEVPRGGGANTLILGIAIPFPKMGQYVFVFRIDNSIQAEWELEAAPIPPPGEKGPRT